MKALMITAQIGPQPIDRSNNPNAIPKDMYPAITGRA